MDLLTLGIIGVVAVIIVAIILWVISIYNSFFSLKNSADATLGQIRVAMKKRLDQIDQLLGAVKSYAKFERETLEKVTSLRASVMQAGPQALGEIDRESRRLFGNILAVAEAYPDLKTQTTVMPLMDSIKGIEDEIARHRYTFNNIAQQFNTMMDTIPSKFVAGLTGLPRLEYLQFEEAISQPPKIEF